MAWTKSADLVGVMSAVASLPYVIAEVRRLHRDKRNVTCLYIADQHHQGLYGSLCFVLGTAHFLWPHLCEESSAVLQNPRICGLKGKSERNNVAFCPCEAKK